MILHLTIHVQCQFPAPVQEILWMWRAAGWWACKKCGVYGPSQTCNLFFVIIPRTMSTYYICQNTNHALTMVYLPSWKYFRKQNLLSSGCKKTNNFVIGLHVSVYCSVVWGPEWVTWKLTGTWRQLDTVLEAWNLSFTEESCSVAHEAKSIRRLGYKITHVVPLCAAHRACTLQASTKGWMQICRLSKCYWTQWITSDGEMSHSMGVLTHIFPHHTHLYFRKKICLTVAAICLLVLPLMKR